VKKRGLNSSNSSEKDIQEREEARRNILEEYPDMPKENLEFVLSLPIERKIPKVMEKGSTDNYCKD
jgi:hypothetical protein